MIFSVPLEPYFGTLLLSSALSQLLIPCVAWLLPTLPIIWDVPTKTYLYLFLYHQTYLHNLWRATYSPHSFRKLSWPGLKPATPRWESQRSNHAATPTCLVYELARLLYTILSIFFLSYKNQLKDAFFHQPLISFLFSSVLFARFYVVK